MTDGDNTVVLPPQYEEQPKPDAVQHSGAADGLSLQERVQARRRELEQAPEHTILLPIPGYAGVLAAEYRPLTAREQYEIETRHDNHTDDWEKILFIAADKLIKGCVRITEPADGENVTDSGYRWNAEGARSLFGCDLPPDATARQAVLAVFPGDRGERDLTNHAFEYETQCDAARAAISKRAEGESAGS